MAITLKELFRKIEAYHEKLPYDTSELTLRQEGNNLILALHAEVDELMRSYQWKPWKESETIDRHNMYIEIVDILFFLGEFMETFDLEPEVLEETFLAKLRENYDRIERGYHHGGS